MLGAQGRQHRGAKFPSLPEGLALAHLRGAQSLLGIPVLLPSMRPSVCRPQTHLGVPSGLAAGGKQLALNSAFVQGSQAGRGRADPLPPLECLLAAPPSRSFSAASPAHFLSPTDPTTKPRTRARTPKHTHTQTHASWRARRPRSPLGDPGRRGSGRSDLLLFKSHPHCAPGPQAPAAPRIRPLPAPLSPASPRPLPRRLQLIAGLPGPQGLGRAVRPRSRASPAPGARCGSALGPLPLPASPPPSFPFSGPASVLPPPPPPSPVRGGPAGRPPRSMASSGRN